MENRGERVGVSIHRPPGPYMREAPPAGVETTHPLPDSRIIKNYGKPYRLDITAVCDYGVLAPVLWKAVLRCTHASADDLGRPLDQRATLGL